MADYPIAEIRSRFPGLNRMVNGNPAIFFDGPGGSQSPESVGEAVKHYLLHQNANVGMSFATSKETDKLIDETCLLYTSPSPRDRTRSRMPSSA